MAETTIPSLFSQAEDHRCAFRMAEALSLYQKILEIAENHPLGNLGLAKILFDYQWKNVEALEKVEAAIYSDPEQPDAFLLRARIHRKLGHFPSAIQDFTRALELGGKPEELLSLRAATYCEILLFAEAERDYDLLLEKHPGSASHRHNRGYVRLKQQKWTEAEADLKKVLEIDPADGYADKGLSEIYDYFASTTPEPEKTALMNKSRFHWERFVKLTED